MSAIRTIEGVQWHTETPSVFVHNDDVAVYFSVSQLTGRRYWSIRTRTEGDLDGYYTSRYAAMQFAKRYVIGHNRSTGY